MFLSWTFSLKGQSIWEITVVITTSATSAANEFLAMPCPWLDSLPGDLTTQWQWQWLQVWWSYSFLISMVGPSSWLLVLWHWHSSAGPPAGSTHVIKGIIVSRISVLRQCLDIAHDSDSQAMIGKSLNWNFKNPVIKPPQRDRMWISRIPWLQCWSHLKIVILHHENYWGLCYQCWLS